jgi:hypothetical protein
MLHTAFGESPFPRTRVNRVVSVSRLGRVTRCKHGGDLFEDHLAPVEPHVGLLLQRRRSGDRQVLLGQVRLQGPSAVERWVLQYPPPDAGPSADAVVEGGCLFRADVLGTRLGGTTQPDTP